MLKYTSDGEKELVCSMLGFSLQTNHCILYTEIMKFVIGTSNKKKITALEKVLADVVSESTQVVGVDINSYVPDTPYNEETKLGAYKRASHLAKRYHDWYCVGVESGLAERYDLLFEEAWACILYKNEIYYGYSSGLLIPSYVRKKMKELNLEHGIAMSMIRKELDQFDDRDTWGTYSGKMVPRDVSLEEALRNTLIQIFAPNQSLYHK